jgi:hypothetical protein
MLKFILDFRVGFLLNGQKMWFVLDRKFDWDQLEGGVEKRQNGTFGVKNNYKTLT